MIKPLGDEDEGAINYQYTVIDGVTSFTAKINRGDKHASIDGSIKLQAIGDWNFGLNIHSSEPEISSVDFKVGITPTDDNKALGTFNLKSPWVRHGIDRANIYMLFDVQPISGSVTANYSIPSVSGDASCLWNWHLLHNMQFALHNRVKRTDSDGRFFQIGVRYLSPDLERNQNMTFGGDLNLNNIWMFVSNNLSLAYVHH